MTHFTVLVIVPRDIFKQGTEAIQKYIEEIMEGYDEELKIDPYVVLTQIEVQEQYNKYMKEHPKCQYTVEQFIEEYHNYRFDSKGNAVSTYNNKCLYDWYEIGGRWDSELKQFNGISNKINLSTKYRNNSASINTLLDHFNTDPEKNIFNVIIDREGGIHRGKEYGWFGTSIDTVEFKEWQSMYEILLEDNTDHYVVSLDCHI